MNILVLSAAPCHALLETLRCAGIGCEHVISCQEVFTAAAEGAFDAVLLHQPGSGVAATLVRTMRSSSRTAAAECADLPVLVVTPAGESAANAVLLDLGVDDVMAATCEPAELLARIRAVVRRARGFARPLLSFGPLTLDPRDRSAIINDSPVALTAREFDVLETLVLRRGRVISKTALMARMDDGSGEAEAKVINVLMCRLRKKLDAAGAFGLISTAWGNGYSLCESAGATLLPLAA